MVTCDQYKEKNCVKEIFNILNDAVERVYPDLDIESIVKPKEIKKEDDKEKENKTEDIY